jgi:hypothetical protein
VLGDLELAVLLVAGDVIDDAVVGWKNTKTVRRGLEKEGGGKN